MFNCMAYKSKYFNKYIIYYTYTYTIHVRLDNLCFYNYPVVKTKSDLIII